MTPVEALQPAIVILGAGTVAALTSRALRLSPMVGYIVAGLIIGPYGLDALREGDTTHVLAELGVVFLLFDIGLHFSVAEMRNSRRDLLILAPLQIIGCGIAFSLLALLLNLSWPVAIAIGLSLALSSTAVVTRILSERGLNASPLGSSSVAVLIFQDIVAIFLLIFANSLTQDAGQLTQTMLMAAAQSVLAFIAAALIGRYVVRPLFNILASAEIEEIFTMTAVLIVVAAAVTTGSIGLSLTLGAFLAGMAIADTPYRHTIQTEVAPFRGLLLSFFFVNVGLMIDVPSLAVNLPIIVGIAIGIILIKTLITYAVARVYGRTAPGATQLSFLMAQASEFTLVVLSIAAIRMTTPGNWVSILVAATALSLALAPFWAGLGMRISHSLAQRLATSRSTESDDDASATPHSPVSVIVYGMTETGRTVLDALSALHVPHVALDANTDRFINAVSDGYSVSYGDTKDFRLLETLGATAARVIVLGEPRYAVSSQISEEVAERFPALHRFVAVNDPAEKHMHETLGMTARVVQSKMDAVALSADVLRHLSVPDEKIAKWMETEIDRIERDAAPADEHHTSEPA